MSEELAMVREQLNRLEGRARTATRISIVAVTFAILSLGYATWGIRHSVLHTRGVEVHSEDGTGAVVVTSADGKRRVELGVDGDRASLKVSGSEQGLLDLHADSHGSAIDMHGGGNGQAGHLSLQSMKVGAAQLLMFGEDQSLLSIGNSQAAGPQLMLTSKSKGDDGSLSINTWGGGPRLMMIHGGETVVELATNGLRPRLRVTDPKTTAYWPTQP